MKAMMIMMVMSFLTMTGVPAFGQDALIMLKFEDAEKAFNSGRYEEALHLLDEVEQAAGVTSKTLYLRVVAENQLLDTSRLYLDDAQFSRLQRVRSHAGKYLNALSAQPIDDKFRTVYRISENLAALPENRHEWMQARAAYTRRLEEQRQKEIAAQKRAAQQEKEMEYRSFCAGLLPLEQVYLHQVARRSSGPAAGQATLYIIRPREGTKNMVLQVLLNEGAVTQKLQPGEYVVYHFSPGLLRIGETDAENKRKVRPGAALLMGGVVGLAATSGKTIAKSTAPFGLLLEAGKSYYVTSVVTKAKMILYRSIAEVQAQNLLSKLDEVKP